jgi:hypothetical protein
MPTFNLTPASYTFKPASPGSAQMTTVDPGLQDVVYSADGQLTIPVTLAITPISKFLILEHPFTPGVFAATLGRRNLTLHGLGPFEPIVSTTGSPVDGTIALSEGVGVQLSILVTFTPPATPMPGLFEASLVLSGWGGTTNMVLVGNSAQITATATLVGADDVFAPVENSTTFSVGGPFVRVKIDLVSEDDAVFNYDVVLASVTPNVIQVSPVTGSLTADYTKVQNRPIFGVSSQLIPLRSKTVTLFATVSDDLPAGSVQAEIQVSSPDPAFSALNPPPTPVPPFTIKPG